MRLLQGVLLAATRGHAAAKTHSCYERARQLADAIGDESQQFRARVGLWASALVGAHLESADTLAGELIALADRGPHPVERLQARWTALVTAVNRSELAKAVSHFDVAMAVAGECDPITQIELFGHDGRVTCRGFAAWAFWMLGWVRRAQQLSVEAVEIAEETTHPHTLAFAYFLRRSSARSEEKRRRRWNGPSAPWPSATSIALRSGERSAGFCAAGRAVSWIRDHPVSRS